MFSGISKAILVKEYFYKITMTYSYLRIVMPTRKHVVSPNDLLLGILWHLEYPPSQTKKQTSVSKLSTDAKYRAMAMTTSQLIWIKSFLASLGVFLKQPIHLFGDNQVKMLITRNPIFHEKTKHIKNWLSFHLRTDCFKQVRCWLCSFKTSIGRHLHQTVARQLITSFTGQVGHY